MSGDDGHSEMQAQRGIDAAAAALDALVERYAVVGGEGARRLEARLAEATGALAVRLEGEGATAARAALGSAAAGVPTAVLASGESLVAIGPVLREMARLGLPVLCVVPSHGADEGAALPASGFDDVAQLAALPVGLLLVGEVAQLAPALVAAQRAAIDRGMPWIVAFELARVGLSQQPARSLPTSLLRAVRTGATAPVVAITHVDPERCGFAIASALRETERQTGRRASVVRAEGPRDPDLAIVASGWSAAQARVALAHLAARGQRASVVEPVSVRPFPSAEIVGAIWRARVVLVHEPMVHPLGSGGVIADAVRAGLADALSWHPDFAGIGRIPPVVIAAARELSAGCWLELARRVREASEPARRLTPSEYAEDPSAVTRIEAAIDPAVRARRWPALCDALVRSGCALRACADEPSRAYIEIDRAPDATGASRVWLVAGGEAYDPATIAALGPGTRVVIAAPGAAHALSREVGELAARGARVRVVDSASGLLDAPGWVLTAVARAALAPDGRADRALFADAEAHRDRSEGARARAARALAGELTDWFT